MGALYLILNVIAVFLLIAAFLDWRKQRNLLGVNSAKKSRVIIVAALIIVLPLLASRFFLADGLDSLPDNFWSIMSIVTSMSISMIWLGYVRSLDVFEKEGRLSIFVTFVMACLTTFLVFPLSGFYREFFDHYLNGSPVNDFLYCVLNIGLIEELVKIIPVLIMIRFTKAVNEPYDYLFYGSVSALGFAFIENSMYLNQYDHFVTNARALFASVAHMTFTSIFAYNLMLQKYKLKSGFWLSFFIGWGLSALAHGFYDFWLVNEWANTYQVLTTLFFIATVHLWTVMKNNALNISPHFDPQIELKNDWVKAYLAVGLLSIAMFSFLVLSMKFGHEVALDFMYRQLFIYGYIILYLIFGLSNYDLVRSYLAPITVPFRFLVPSYKGKHRFIGSSFKLRMPIDPRFRKPHLEVFDGVDVLVLERMAYMADTEWRLVKIEKEFKSESYRSDVMAIRHRDESPELQNPQGTIVRVMLFKEKTATSKGRWVFVGYMKARLLS